MIFRIIWFDDEGQVDYCFAVAAKSCLILLFSRQKNSEIYIDIHKNNIGLCCEYRKNYRNIPLVESKFLVLLCCISE